MGGHTTPELVAAVSNAGGLGILGASRLTTQQLYVHVIGFVYQSIDIEIGSKGLTTNLTENITCAQRL
jgi:NAD(P)H-dependent flavin oxidoreductase YrpB (nitropropane dioxygenase family)